MRIVRVAVMMVLFFGGAAAAHGQIGGDEPGGHVTPPPPTASPKPPAPMRVSSEVMAGLVESKVIPVYPADARNLGIQGQVLMHAIIGKDGHIIELTVISGPEELRRAATDAVSQWTYKPYLLNGQPVEVDTTVFVNFNLRSRPPS